MIHLRHSLAMHAIIYVMRPFLQNNTIGTHHVSKPVAAGGSGAMKE